MAQVPILVSIQHHAPSQQYENPLLIILHLPQHSPLYASKGAEITNSVIDGYTE